MIDISKIIYPCSPYLESTGFTKLMYLVINTRKNPISLQDIQDILDNDILEIDKQNDESWTPIMLAVRNYNTVSTPDTVRLLLRYKPNLYLENSNNQTVIDLCVMNYYKPDFFDIFKLLMDNININYKNKSGENILMRIIKNSILLDKNLVKFFLDNYSEKIDMNTENNLQQTAYNIAISLKLYDIAEIISSYYYALEKYALD